MKYIYSKDSNTICVFGYNQPKVRIFQTSKLKITKPLQAMIIGYTKLAINF